MKTPFPRIVVGALGLAAGAASVPAASLLTYGHVDLIDLAWDGASLVPHSRVYIDAKVDDVLVTSDTDFAPGQLTLVVSPQAFTAYGDGLSPAERAALGITGEAGLWVLPQSEDAWLPFAGLSTGTLDPQEWSGDLVIRLLDLSGPGHFSMWQTDPQSHELEFLVSTVDGLDADDRLTARAGVHVHYNWGFTAPGDYVATYAITGAHVTAGPQSIQASYRFHVIPEPSLAVLTLGGLGAAWLRRQRVTGEKKDRHALRAVAVCIDLNPAGAGLVGSGFRLGKRFLH